MDTETYCARCGLEFGLEELLATHVEQRGHSASISPAEEAYTVRPASVTCLVCSITIPAAEHAAHVRGVNHIARLPLRESSPGLDSDGSLLSSPSASFSASPSPSPSPRRPQHAHSASPSVSPSPSPSPVRRVSFAETTLDLTADHTPQPSPLATATFCGICRMEFGLPELLEAHNAAGEHSDEVMVREAAANHDGRQTALCLVCDQVVESSRLLAHRLSVGHRDGLARLQDEHVIDISFHESEDDPSLLLESDDDDGDDDGDGDSATAHAAAHAAAAAAATSLDDSLEEQRRQREALQAILAQTAEAEATAKAQRKAEAEAEAEAQRKAKAEAEAEAEAQRKAKAEAEAQRRAEAAAKREADRKRQAEAAAKRQAEAAAKREADAAKRQAEAAAKREADRKRQAEAAAKRQAEADKAEEEVEVIAPDAPDASNSSNALDTPGTPGASATDTNTSMAEPADDESEANTSAMSAAASYHSPARASPSRSRNMTPVMPTETLAGPPVYESPLMRARAKREAAKRARNSMSAIAAAGGSTAPSPATKAARAETEAVRAVIEAARKAAAAAREAGYEPPKGEHATIVALGESETGRNSGIVLNSAARGVLNAVRVNKPGVTKRAAELCKRRSIKTAAQLGWLTRAVTLCELTTLAGDDTDERVRRLAAKAASPVRCDLLAAVGLDASNVTAAAVCVYVNRVPQVLRSAGQAGVAVAAAAGGFPAALTDMDSRLGEVAAAVAHGATEIDVVVARAHIIAHAWDALYEELRTFVAAAGPDVRVKAVLAIHQLPTLRDVYKATLVAAFAGVDMVCSTPTATATPMPVGLTMLRALREYHEISGFTVGLKIGGGIAAPKAALQSSTA
ncbi:deoxyribose-phosphate aldolase [Thecamonas trahens ATCC 50062]|uniref:deoxyribose-phosphate aldolase n=1 Tax=Thecamonas trahens ATCC 50062 TaxID=461836 RepID=A0A0L0D5Z9_THETB|nr:deoxyribose-phosphate aldolase [Thecamonas trahens ATCC 50062]KNC47605.1 deoxyribose-phosphate aldolase [Thecamonas trahens ATCC 50062]|eukprot:XP_013759530.1 deoxyribose-phosphate aldolase [Thecamonas trahens ATCC 50062]